MDFDYSLKGFPSQISMLHRYSWCVEEMKLLIAAKVLWKKSIIIFMWTWMVSSYKYVLSCVFPVVTPVFFATWGVLVL